MNQKIPFTKMQGTGNDFVVIDALRRPIKLSAALARALSDRHFGVGCDQILILEKSKRADFRMRVINTDGSEAEMCGNGIRCAALYAYQNKHVRSKIMTVETLAGMKRPHLLAHGQVRVDMGEPILDAAAIPTRGKGRVMDHPFVVGKNQKIRLTSVSMGNPHAVVFVGSLDKTPAAQWGPNLETHSFFPKRTNVEFVEVISPSSAKVKVWERGAGFTLACGTGACAVAVAGVLTGRLWRKVNLSLPGGDLQIEWAADNHVYMTGDARFVFEGEWLS